MRRSKSVELRKLLKAVLLGSLLFLCVGVFTSCSNGDSTGAASNDAQSTTGDGVKTIGIVQIVEHPSLNTIRESFIQKLAEEGYQDGKNIKIDYQNAQGDQTNLKSICQKFARNKYDLIVAIATPSAQAAAGETKEIPVLFAACTDPVSSGLVASLDRPGANVTGTSDAVSAEKIMELAKRITPGFKTIGALYNSGEANSVSVINDLKEYASKNGMTVIEGTVTNTSEVQQVTQSLAEKADILFSPIDNTVASAMPVVAQVAKRAKKPIYVGADSMVKDGGLATYGINYQVLGEETAKMAIEILNGKNPADMPVKLMDEMDIYLNQETAAAIGITFPDDIVKEAKQIFGK
ncbi:cobalt import ABC transporter, substrate-binding protein [Thermacetogenium phaeum DSM 12270]|uniref:Cobalt import ABC transporter, substrate-binding protein n=1 Tax=Thermacetogenium phaeum (strain ATCC BAA-254 / DSM 26808 / PB) TaxID=1089553 RepID=K4LGN5_THEPS|nr:ABC transporter substrate-binding protein [Thermacetogenium phaeum]AFV12028.1 cobalt import ABC transporter, substrate-binding protein [Thermacetogenium phaeum DSM 12270]